MKKSLSNPLAIERLQDRLLSVNRYILTYICASPLTVLSVAIDLFVDDDIVGMLRVWAFYTVMIDGSLLLLWIINHEIGQALQRRKVNIIRQLIAKLGKESPTI